ncbi:MAG TPA: hypothetical protein ENJ93_00835 [Chloroflexi bacterium]|nr:hypothetical protein [Chloroflexota bacterium]
MWIKRIILAVIAFAIGFGATFVIVKLIGTNLEEYGIWYTFFTSLAIACAVGVWLDKFMGTNLMPK